MLSTVINAIFKGEVLPWEPKSIKTLKHAELLRKIGLEREHFEEEMSPHEKGRFDQYNCLISERATEEIGTAEYDLFMLGIIVGMEIMEHKQKILEELGG